MNVRTMQKMHEGCEMNEKMKVKPKTLAQNTLDPQGKVSNKSASIM